MNDPPYVEAARALAERMMLEGGATPAGRAARGFELATARPPAADESAVLTAAYRDHLKRYQTDPKAAAALIQTGQKKPDEKLDPAQLAAWTMVANLILNMDEVINKN